MKTAVEIPPGGAGHNVPVRAIHLKKFGVVYIWKNPPGVHDEISARAVLQHAEYLRLVGAEHFGPQGLSKRRVVSEHVAVVGAVFFQVTRHDKVAVGVQNHVRNGVKADDAHINHSGRYKCAFGSHLEQRKIHAPHARDVEVPGSGRAHHIAAIQVELHKKNGLGSGSSLGVCQISGACSSSECE